MGSPRPSLTGRADPLTPLRTAIGRAAKHVLEGPGPVEARITFCHTDGMAKAISVRLDDEAERAMRALEASGLSRSEAIRGSLLASAKRLRRGKDLAAEAAALEADEDDRAEMLSVATLIESLRAPR
jgi:Arc/MetJ-type ribon-helix-helix transcriptional regulator